MDDRPHSFLTAVRRHTRPADALALSVVPLVLLAVYALPAATKERLALSYADPSALSLYTMHFVHFRLTHLLTNLVSYAIAASVVFLLCALSRRRKRFYATLCVFLFAFPLVVSLLNVALVRPRLGYGFSALNVAFFGFLPVALLGYVGDRFTTDVTLDHAPLLFFLGAGTIALFAAPRTLPGYTASSLAGVSCALYGRSLLDDLTELSLAGFRRALDPAGYLELAAFALTVFVLFPFAAFPNDVLHEGVLVNVYVHLLGYCLGYIAPWVTFRVVDLD